jgi:hypothetical protein
MLSSKNIGKDEIDSYIIMYYRSICNYSNIIITRVIDNTNSVYTYIDCIDNLIRQRKRFTLNQTTIQMIINENLVAEGYVIKSYNNIIKENNFWGIKAEIIIMNNKIKKLIK